MSSTPDYPAFHLYVFCVKGTEMSDGKPIYEFDIQKGAEGNIYAYQKPWLQVKLEGSGDQFWLEFEGEEGDLSPFDQRHNKEDIIERDYMGGLTVPEEDMMEFFKHEARPEAKILTGDEWAIDTVWKMVCRRWLQPVHVRCVRQMRNRTLKK